MNINDVIILPFNKNVLAKTSANTISKYSHTHRTLMYGRTPVELLDNIFMGDLAKNSLLEYLRPLCDKPIIDYDEIRKDNFTNPDPGWDFKIGNNLIKVEVKSSIPPNNESHQAIINNRDIKITASHDKGDTWIRPETLECDIHIQIYFYAKTYRNGYNDFQTLYDDLVANPTSIHRIINSNKYNQPLFFGWDTKENIINYVNTLNPNTWTFSWTKRIYWRCPISKSYSLPKLIEYINTS